MLFSILLKSISIPKCRYEHKYAYIVLEIGACSLRNVIDHKKIR